MTLPVNSKSDRAASLVVLIVTYGYPAPTGIHQCLVAQESPHKKHLHPLILNEIHPWVNVLILDPVHSSTPHHDLAPPKGDPLHSPTPYQSGDDRVPTKVASNIHKQQSLPVDPNTSPLNDLVENLRALIHGD